jgi:hypothetical protein
MGFAAQRRDRQAALRESIATGRLTEAVAPDLVWDMSAFRGWSGEPTSTGTPGSPGSWKRGVSPTALGVWPSSSSSTRATTCSRSSPSAAGSAAAAPRSDVRVTYHPQSRRSRQEAHHLTSANRSLRRLTSGALQRRRSRASSSAARAAARPGTPWAAPPGNVAALPRNRPRTGVR